MNVTERLTQAFADSPDRRALFTPRGTEAAPTSQSVLGSYRGPAKDTIGPLLERFGARADTVKDSVRSQAAAGAGQQSAAATAALGEAFLGGGADAAALRAAADNPVYGGIMGQQMLAQHGITLPAPEAAAVADDVVGAAAHVADDVVDKTTAKFLDEAFAMISELGDDTQRSIFAHAVDARAAATGADDVTRVLAGAIAHAPPSEGAPALQSAIAKILGATDDAAHVAQSMSTASKVAGEAAPLISQASTVAGKSAPVVAQVAKAGRMLPMDDAIRAVLRML